MTVSSETARTRYSGNGVTTTFSTGFIFQANAAIRVILTDADGTDTEWVENTQYALTGADTGSNGTVTVVTSPTDYTPLTGQTLTIIRDVPFTQELDGTVLSTMSAEEQEAALDKIWMGMGQLKEELSRALVGSETGPGGAADFTAWSPVLAVASDSERRVLQVVGWEGGSGDEPDSGDYVGATGLVASIADGVDVRGAAGAAGASGAGTGDMLKSANLSDVSSAATSFANIKQAATTSATGVSELCTDAEAIAKADTARTITASNLAALGSTSTFAGFVELATNGEAVTGTDTARAVTPAGVAAAIAAGSSSFPAGTAMLFMQTSAPTGWTKSSTHNDKALRVVSGTASSGGSVNFSTLFARTTTDAVTLIQANLPSVTLTLNDTDILHGPAISGAAVVGDGANVQGWVGTAPSPGGGTVPLGGSSTAFAAGIDCRVKYADVIVATKD